MFNILPLLSFLALRLFFFFFMKGAADMSRKLSSLSLLFKCLDTKDCTICLQDSPYGTLLMGLCRMIKMMMIGNYCVGFHFFFLHRPQVWRRILGHITRTVAGRRSQNRGRNGGNHFHPHSHHTRSAPVLFYFITI